MDALAAALVALCFWSSQAVQAPDINAKLILAAGCKRPYQVQLVQTSSLTARRPGKAACKALAQSLKLCRKARNAFSTIEGGRSGNASQRRSIFILLDKSRATSSVPKLCRITAYTTTTKTAQFVGSAHKNLKMRIAPTHRPSREQRRRLFKCQLWDASRLWQRNCHVGGGECGGSRFVALG